MEFVILQRLISVPIGKSVYDCEFYVEVLRQAVAQPQTTHRLLMSLYIKGNTALPELMNMQAIDIHR